MRGGVVALSNINGTSTKRTRATVTSGKLSTGAFVVTADIDLGNKTVAVSGGVALFGPPGGPMPKISLGYFKLAAGASFSINRRVHELSRHVELQTPFPLAAPVTAPVLCANG